MRRRNSGSTPREVACCITLGMREPSGWYLGAHASEVPSGRIFGGTSEFLSHHEGAQVVAGYWSLTDRRLWLPPGRGRSRA